MRNFIVKKLQDILLYLYNILPQGDSFSIATNDQVRITQALSQLIQRYGSEVYSSTQRCRSFLKDSCPFLILETNILVMAVEAGIVKELLNPNPILSQELVNLQLTNRLRDTYGLQDELAQWAVDTWLLVLNPNSHHKLNSLVKKILYTLKTCNKKYDISIVLYLVLPLAVALIGLSFSRAIGGESIATIILLCLLISAIYLRYTMDINIGILVSIAGRFLLFFVFGIFIHYFCLSFVVNSWYEAVGVGSSGLSGFLIGLWLAYQVHLLIKPNWK